MSEVLLRGETVNTIGVLPKVGDQLPDFTLTTNDLGEVSLSDYAGKKLLLNIFPSVDTGICAQSQRHFNEAAASLDNTVVIGISNDLPFAQSRFCAAEGIENVETFSAFRSEFGKDYGVLLTDGGLKGLLSRSVIVADENGKVLYVELVPEIGQEPDYDSALAALK